MNVQAFRYLKLPICVKHGINGITMLQQQLYTKQLKCEISVISLLVHNVCTHMQHHVVHNYLWIMDILNKQKTYTASGIIKLYKSYFILSPYG